MFIDVSATLWQNFIAIEVKEGIMIYLKYSGTRAATAEQEAGNASVT